MEREESPAKVGIVSEFEGMLQEMIEAEVRRFWNDLDIRIIMGTLGLPRRRI